MKHLIVIPAFNEEETLAQTLADLEQLGGDFEIVIVNDGSADGTEALAARLAQTSRLIVHLIRLPFNCGIGVAVQTGYRFALERGAYECVVQFDADGQHAAADLPILIEKCLTDRLDLCVGSRFLDEGGEPFHSPWPRRLGNRFLSWLIGALGRIRVTDATSGFRCAGPRAWRRFAQQYPEDYPEPESLFWCARNGLRVGEVAVHMRPRQGGVSSLHSFRPAYYMVKVSLAILLDWLRSRESF